MARCALALLLTALVSPPPVAAQARLLDESDRAAFRAWFVFLADAQFYRRTDDVTDCAALVRHAYREALRAHTPEWRRLAALPLAPSFPDVRHPPRAGAHGWPLFQTSDGPAPRFAEFADARTIVHYNARRVSRDISALRPGDLLYFSQADRETRDHLMVFVGESAFERDGHDWIVYHTGPDASDPGEVRKVRLVDLLQHPAPRWRPVAANPAFVGVFRLMML
jgi:uncharacterized protein YfaT (DUF1175 family)